MPEIYTSTQKGPPDKSDVAVNNTRQALSAFMVKPQGVHFETQEKAEQILLLMRQHPITNFGWIAITLILLVLPTILAPVFISTGILPTGVPGGYYVIIPLIWYIGIFGYAFTNFLGWYFNVYVVTNERVVDIDWISLLYKQLSSTQLTKIQDVTYKQGGILDSFFDFGNVFIQTAGNEPNFEFASVPRPETVVRQINKIISHEEDSSI